MLKRKNCPLEDFPREDCPNPNPNPKQIFRGAILRWGGDFPVTVEKKAGF